MTGGKDRSSCVLVDRDLVPYRQAFDDQKIAVARLQRGGDETLFLLEHPHVITLGRNAKRESILGAEDAISLRGVEIVETDRGGDITYHGPGQLVGYPVISLEPGRRDIRRYVDDLEEVLIRALDGFGISARRHPVHRGVWVGDRKIASLGIRISRWVTCHGFALNVNTDLEYYRLITPCGIAGCEMTSVRVETNSPVAMADVKQAVIYHFSAVFGRSLVAGDIGASVGA